MKRGKAVWVIVLLVSATLAGMKVFPVFFDRPLISGKSQALSSLRVVQIPEGATFRQVATLLEKEQVIRSRWVFLALGKLDGTQRRILAGEYAFHAGMKPSDILSELRQGHVVLHRMILLDKKFELVVQVFQAQQRPYALIERIFVDDQDDILWRVADGLYAIP